MKYIPAEKLIAYLKKTMESYMSQMVDPTKYPIDHIDLMAFLAREYQAIIANVELLQQEQPEVDLYNNGWIDCRKQMPKETKQWSDTLQGHREWTESDLVLAWDSMYGCRVDATKNGKWMSEQRGGYTGQIVHGIIAWRPIPEFNEELLFNARKEE